MEQEIILSVKNLEVKFDLRGRILHAIRGISLDLYKSESLAIVGESGSGKSVLVKTFMGLLDANGAITGGEILYDGQDLSKFKTEKQWLTVRGKEIAMVLQDPMTSLNPLKTIGFQVCEAIELHQGLKGAEARAAAVSILEDVGISDAENRIHQYPHEFSGGMRQRIMIAMALICNPKLLIANEPTTALDVTIQAQILDLMRRLKDELGMSIMLITHDLGVVAEMADYVVVMYAGKIVERGPVMEIFARPTHPYTTGLLKSKPVIGKTDHNQRLYSIPGQVPNPIDMPDNCYFNERCEACTEECKMGIPALKDLGNGHFVACFNRP